ncbi:MAG: hypothetical protein ACOY15_03375 [Pseudomonadota bacterium]
MPINHGIYCNTIAGAPMVFRYGVLQIFQGLKIGLFSENQKKNQKEIKKAAQLEHHFRTAFMRFVFALEDLNVHMQELADGQPTEPGWIILKSARIKFRAECLADHVLTYLNMIIDDVAILVALATGFNNSHPIDNMGKLRNPNHRNDKALAPFKSLLDDLDLPGSWWDLAFKKAKGARQLLVHNHYFVNFQLSGAPDAPLKAQASLLSPFAENVVASGDFFGLLRDLLSSLFDWLDRLEIILTSYLCKKYPGWSPTLSCYNLSLPIGYPLELVRYEMEYFPIPLCEGSDALPWTILSPVYSKPVSPPSSF